MAEDFVTEEIHRDEAPQLESLDDYYKSLQLLVESLESDVIKANKGNKSAGVRLRKSLRALKGNAADFIKFTLRKD